MHSELISELVEKESLRLRSLKQSSEIINDWNQMIENIRKIDTSF